MKSFPVCFLFSNRNYLCASRYFTTSPIVLICSRSSDGISTSNSSSNAITISNKSRESAPRSSLKDVSSVSSAASAFYDSATISLIFSNMVSFPFLIENISPSWDIISLRHAERMYCNPALPEITTQTGLPPR